MYEDNKLKKQLTSYFILFHFYFSFSVVVLCIEESLFYTAQVFFQFKQRSKTVNQRTNGVDKRKEG